MEYILFLRGINVGGKHKVVMAELRQDLSQLGLDSVKSYINSGNLYFVSNLTEDALETLLEEYFNSHYDFPIAFALLSGPAFQAEMDNQPNWWQENLARRDVLFFSRRVNRQEVEASLASMSLGNEEVFLGQRAVFWGKRDEADYLKTAYHKQLGKQAYYSEVTIRNAKTCDKMLTFLQHTQE
ncbi:DUF1697 domain-containing protein [Vaginisenegalia massiliensis]|uniref:DUF1697 domain-containing protein n=1 Tax=Vaginisenegalia massiliensis TaxID=2058294 RepID=UPI000F51BCF9|nr:DUF1697 domain-containing protein [Vaginisenegalia massiliensis]